jgi:hypothetical protein
MYGDGAIINKGLNGKCLEPLYSVESSWETWLKLHPKTLVLSENNGLNANYNINPYSDFWQDNKVPEFLTAKMRSRLSGSMPYKETVMGVLGETGRKAYRLTPGLRLENDFVGNVPVAIFSDVATHSVFVFERKVDGRVLTFEREGNGKGGLPTFSDVETGSEWSLDGIAFEGELSGKRMPLMPSYKAFWYAWSVFFPEAELEMDP